MDTQSIIDTDIIFKPLAEMYEERIPFNKLLGIRVKALEMDQVQVELDMRDEMIGNFVMKTLHGGVISAVLDATGGLMASLSVINRMADRPADEIKKRMARVGTIDLRIDYLRPGRGRAFLATSTPMRTGRKVAVIRMEFYNDQKVLLAVGTGTYTVG